MISLNRSAVVVIDVQNDFCHPDGVLAQSGADMRPIRQMVDALKSFIEIIERSEVPIVYVGNAHDQWSDSAAWMKRHKSGADRICRSNSWGAEFFELKPRSKDKVIQKHRYSAFVGTDFELVLRSRGINTLILTGIATNICVETTARDAVARDFGVVLVPDCLAGTSDDEHQASIRTLQKYFAADAISSKPLIQSLTHV